MTRDDAPKKIKQPQEEVSIAVAELLPQAPSAFVNGAGIHADDKPSIVIRKLDAAFHDALSSQASAAPAVDAWRELFWAVARTLNCLPSSFVEGNAHVYKQAEAYAQDAARWRAWAQGMVDADNENASFFDALDGPMSKALDAMGCTIEAINAGMDAAMAAIATQAANKKGNLP